MLSNRIWLDAYISGQFFLVANFDIFLAKKNFRTKRPKFLSCSQAESPKFFKFQKILNFEKKCKVSEYGRVQTFLADFFGQQILIFCQLEKTFCTKHRNFCSPDKLKAAFFFQIQNFLIIGIFVFSINFSHEAKLVEYLKFSTRGQNLMRGQNFQHGTENLIRTKIFERQQTILYGPKLLHGG